MDENCIRPNCLILIVVAFTNRKYPDFLKDSSFETPGFFEFICFLAFFEICSFFGMINKFKEIIIFGSSLWRRRKSSLCPAA